MASANSRRLPVTFIAPIVRPLLRLAADRRHHKLLVTCVAAHGSHAPHQSSAACLVCSASQQHRILGLLGHLVDNHTSIIRQRGKDPRVGHTPHQSIHAVVVLIVRVREPVRIAARPLPATGWPRRRRRGRRQRRVVEVDKRVGRRRRNE
eukprot:363926-Chlamydomonas_euryale.AAC.2